MEWHGTEVGFVTRALCGTTMFGWTPTGDAGYEFGMLWAVAPYAVLCGMACFWRAGRSSSDEPQWAIRTATWLWLAMGFVFLKVYEQQHLQRYWMHLLVPTAALVALGFGDPGPKPRLQTRWQRIAAALGLGVAPFLVVRGWLVELVGPAQGSLFRWVALLSAILATLAVLWVALVPRARWFAALHRAGQRLPLLSTATAVVIALGVVIDLAAVIGPRYTVRDAGRALYEPDVEKRLVGDVANTLALETPYFAFVYRDLSVMGQGNGTLNADFATLRPTDYLLTVAIDSLPYDVGRPPWFDDWRLERSIGLVEGKDGVPRVRIRVLTDR